MSREDFDAIREYCKSKHDARAAKTPERVAYAEEQLQEAGIRYVVKNASIGHIHAWNNRGKLFQFWAGTGKIMNHNARGIENFIRLVGDKKEPLPECPPEGLEPISEEVYEEYLLWLAGRSDEDGC